MAFDMEFYDSWKANHKGDKEPSKKIIALGKKITDVAGHMIGGVTVEDPEYWGLAEIITEEMAEVGLTMKRRKHYTFKQMCELNHIKPGEEEKFQKLLDEMSYIGLLEYDYGNHYDHNGRTAPQSERRYTLPIFVPGSAELFNIEELPDRSNPRLRDHPDIGAFFERMTYLPLKGITQMVPPGGSGVGMHVIPVEQAISLENKSEDIEHISYWLKKYEGHIGVGRCSCRASRKAIGDGCADDDFGWCIGVGDFADYCRETGKGHDITYDEAIAILKRAEENGFVHQITNIDGENKIFGICNCNPEICNALRTSQMFNTPNMSASAYRAHVDKSKCVACGRCVEYCPAGAVKLGQKLCNKEGKEFLYPRQQLPDNVRWGEDKYDPDYRDHNRINTHETGTAPCKTACPAHIAVQGYLKMAKEGRFAEALELIKRQNPFPAVCGQICNRRCEDACTRGTIDQAVAIDSVKRYIAELDLKAETRFVPPVVIPASIHRNDWDEKIAIIGAGPAGMSCAYYLAVKGYHPVVFEKSQQPGGMLMNAIPSFRLEKDVVRAEIDVLRELGVEFRCGVEVGKDVTIAQLREEGYKGFYVAVGLQNGGKLGVPGDDLQGVEAGIDFVRRVNADETTKVQGKVVVIGGGNIGADVARTAIRCGAESVSLYCLEGYDEMPMGEEDRTECEKDGITIHAGWGQVAVSGNDGKAASIRFKKCVRVRDEEGKFAPVFDEHITEDVACDTVLYCIGQKVDWGTLLSGTKVEFNRNGTAKADSISYQTAEPDIFVGGDAYTGQKFAIDAIAAGHWASESLHRYVQDGHMILGRNRWEFNMLDKENICVKDYDKGQRNKEKIDESAAKTFRKEEQTFTAEQVKAESSRCLGCGASIVDPNKCIGCGVCTTKCAFDAITLHRDHPECSTMRDADDKFKGIIPYELKRIGRIITHYKSPEEKEYEKQYQEFLKSNGK